MGRSGIKVVVRTRPTATFAQNQIHIDQDENTITINSGQVHTNDAPSNRKESWKFRYHQVLHNAGQDTVYEAIARDIVHGAIVDGINGTIMAYGQTGAGKTFTMIGDTRNYQYRGVAPRTVAQIFHEVEQRIEVTYTIKVSYMEIYNDRIYDLLSTSDKNQEYVIVEDAKGTCVRGLTQIEVESEKEALDQLFNGEINRTVAEHQLNKHSNRSHCIFTFHVSQKSRAGGSERVIHSKLHLVDLAGSERLKKTMSEDTNKGGSIIKKESMYINQSLTYLEQCIVALGSKEQRHIPYRQTKLTNVLKDSLGGNCNTLMFACIWGESKHLEETISTLKLAQRMMRVQNEATSIVETDPLMLIKKYERQIKDLKQELNMHDALVERTGVVYDEHTPEQIHALMKMLRAYVDCDTDDAEDLLQLTSMQQIRELFRQAKILIRNAESDIGGVGRGGADSSRAGTVPRTASASGTNEAGLDGTHNGGPENAENALVGEFEDDGGFGVGLAADSARPISVDAKRGGDNDVAEGKETAPEGAAIEPEASGAKEASDSKAAPLSTDIAGLGRETKNEAFALYREGPGIKTTMRLRQEKDALKQLKQKYKAISAKVNSAKRLIDELKVKLQDKRSTQVVDDRERLHAGIEDDVVDEEEFILMKQEREAKKEYRSIYDELRATQLETEKQSTQVEKLKEALIDEFEEWYRQGGKSETEDKLDDGEQFDKLEIDRVYAEDPESLAFFQAQKKFRQTAAGMGISNAGQKPTRRRK